jgi:prephenate dehydrogenase
MKAVGVVGLGQIGGSLALSLLARGIDVVGFDIDGSTKLAAKARGVRVTTELESLIAQSAVVFCCVSLDANKEVLSRLLELAKLCTDGSPVLSDVASRKGGTLPNIPLGTRFVAGHPMAGSHGWGFASAWPGLFENSVWNLVFDTPPPSDALIALIEVIASTGASVHACSTQWHDETVALISGLPHAFAVVLGVLSTEISDIDARLTLAAGSYSGASRVLLSEPRFVAGLLRHNAPTLRGLLQHASASLETISKTLDDADSLQRLVLRARAPIDRLHTTEWRPEVRQIRSVTFSQLLMELRDSGSLVDRIQRNGEDVEVQLRSRCSMAGSH